MPVVRSTRWDHATLPYVPRRPCLLYYLVPGDTVPRVAVPNARGEYTNLVPGMPYREEGEAGSDCEEGEDEVALPLMEFAPPLLRESVATQVEWIDLPVPPPTHLQRFEAPTKEEQK